MHIYMVNRRNNNTSPQLINKLQPGAERRRYHDMKQQLAHWKGSIQTADAVRDEIAKRYGEEEAVKYDPLKNCFTFQTWKAKGYYVKKGEKAIRSMTLIEAEDKNAKEGTETEKRTYPKTVYLFYITQVEKKK